MLWAQIVCAIASVIAFFGVVSEKDAGKRLFTVAVYLFLLAMGICAGEYSHILGWPH